MIDNPELGTLRMPDVQPRLSETSGRIRRGDADGCSQRGGLWETEATETVRVLISGAATSEFGKIVVTGLSSLNGTIAVRLADGLAPTFGQSFNSLIASAIDLGATSIADEDAEDAFGYQLVLTSTGSVQRRGSRCLSAGLTPMRVVQHCRKLLGWRKLRVVRTDEFTTPWLFAMESK